MKVLTKVKKFFGPCEYGVYDGVSVWKKRQNDKNIISYLKAMNFQGKHIFIRPRNEENFILVDDLTLDQVYKHHADGRYWRPGRMCVETSPGNFQVWLHSENKLSLETKSYWLKKMCSDPGAAPSGRWGRCPNFTNKKEKYQRADGSYPYVNLIWCDYLHKVKIPDISVFSIFPSPLSDKVKLNKGGGSVPVYSHISRANFKAVKKDGSPDHSVIDFRFCLSLLRNGETEENIKNRLLSERSEWGNHTGGNRQEAYLNRTIERARLVLCNRA